MGFRIRQGITFSVFAGCLAAATVTSAAPVVTRIDADTLRVIHTEGKPPYKREIINQSRSPDRFAYYAERTDQFPRAVYASETRRIPGKQLSTTSMHVSSDPQTLVDFARFEETEEPRTNGRRWRGTPGKGLYRSGR